MGRTLAVLAAVALSLSAGAGLGAAAHEEPERSLLGIELEGDGDATVYYVDSYDLEADEERATYESYAENETRRAEFRQAAVVELEAAAGNGSEAAAWEMRIDNVSVRTYEQDGYGRVEVRVDWKRLAYADQRRVIVAEPFRSGYEPDREVAIHGPKGYRRNVTAPSPLRAQQNSVLLNPLTSDFSGFYMEFVDPDAAPTATETTDDDDGDGEDAFEGLDAVLRALLIALVPAVLVVLAVRRQ